MTSKETIFLKCICLHGVHEDIGADVLRNDIQSQHGVNVVRIEEVTGAEANRKLKRWILELEGELYVKTLKGKSLEINSDGYSGTVEFKKPIECEVPPSWTMPQFPGPVVGHSTVYQNYGAAGGYGPEQMGPGNEQMGKMYGQMNPGHGQMSQGHEPTRLWEGQMCVPVGDGQMVHGHGQMGQGLVVMEQGPAQMGQGPAQMGPQSPPQQQEVLHQQQSGHEQSSEVSSGDNDEHLQESAWPDTTMQKAEERGTQNVETVEENKKIKEPQTKVKLTHLPSGVDEDYVQMILEDKMMGSLSVENVVIDNDTNCAEVEMVTPEGTQIFAEWLQVTNEPEEEFTDDSPPSIIVTGFHEGTQEDEIRMLFESKQFKDVEVVDIQFNKDALSAIIIYSSLKDVDRVMEMCPLKLLGSLVQCERHQRGTYKKPESPKPLEPKILVKGLPEGIDEDDIKMFFENKRKFIDVEIVAVECNKESSSAVITYSSKNDVELVMGKCPLTMLGRQIVVERFGGSDAYGKPSNNDLITFAESAYDDAQARILVEDIPDGVDEDFLKMCFTSKKLYMCTIENIDFDKVNRNAVITFSSAEDVKVVLNNCPIKIKKKEVSVQIYVPKKLCTIIVRGPKGIMKEKNDEIFEMYFKNEKKSGGGDIREINCRPSENAFYITYKDEFVAKRVAERNDHRIMRNDVQVELFIPSRSTKESSGTINNADKKGRKVSECEVEKNPESRPVKTVKVRGVKKVASRESVQYYFENKKKAGGGDIERLFTNAEDDDVIYIEYKDESVAKAVAEKQHTLEGNALVVSLYTPPVLAPSYPNKLLIKGLNPKTTFNVLNLYMEAKAAISLVEGSMTYHAEQEDVVLVTVDGDIDMSKLEEVCRTKPLEGSNLRCSPVPISNCVLVSNLSDAATKDLVRLYFENEKRSKGGIVDNVEIFSTQNYCLVYFDDYKIVDNVLSKEQILEGKTLEVKRYFPCIARAEGDTVERRFKNPTPCTVKANVQKIKFLNRSKTNREALEKQLSMCHASIVWPTASDSEEVEISCTLSEDVKDCVKLAKDWKTGAQSSFEDFMNTLEVAHVVVVQDILKKVTDELGTISIDNPEAVAILIQMLEQKIYVVGLKGKVLGLKQDVERIVQRIQEAAEKEKSWTKTVITQLKSIETSMLLADKFPRHIEEQFPDVKVKINKSKNEIEIEGISSLVNKVQIKMYEIKDTYVKSSCPKIPKEMLELYMKKQVKDHIVKKLQHHKVVVVWETMPCNLIVMSKTDEMLKLAVDIVSNSVFSGSIQLTPESRASVQTDTWEKVKKKLIEDNQGNFSIEITLDTINVKCTDDIYESVMQTINEFLVKNTVYSDSFSFAAHIHQLLKKNHQPDVGDIAKQRNVAVRMGENEIEITGSQNDIKTVKKELEILATSVKKQRHSVSKPGISDFIYSEKGHGIIKTVESTFPVVVKSSDEDSGDDECGIYSTGPSASNLPPGCFVLASCRAYETRNIHVMFGDMTELDVDAIVNAADEKLSLCGGLGKAILKKGGDAIAEDCKKYIDAHKKFGEATVFVSTAGDLKAKSIVHVVGPVWKNGMHEEDDKLSEVVFKAMHQAYVKGYKSVALPAISCGAYGYPVKRATGVIVASVKNFFREVQESELTEIYLCDMKDDTVTGFVDGLEKEWGASSVRRFNRRQSSSATLPPGAIRPLDSSDEENTDTHSSVSRKDAGKPRPQQPNRALSVKLGNITVAVQKAEIADHNIPVIVNTTSRNLDLNNGAVSKTILQQAGPEIQNELKESYPHGISEGQVAVTKGYKLKCTNVVHGAVSNWDPKQQKKTIDELKSFVNLCLEETQKRNLSGIAFPAIGTGNLGYPKKVVAREMLTAVKEFATNYPQSCIQNVDFILYPKDEGTIKAFESEITSWAKGGGKVRARGYDHYENLRSRRGEDGDHEHLYEELPLSNESSDLSIGNVRIKVIQGDLTNEAVDCIINSSNEDLDFKRGKVSQTLVKICGDELLKEAHSKQGEMKTEGFVITKSHGLTCKHILHVVAKKTAQEWRHVVLRCLRKAKAEGYQSIAFPALGTGMNISSADTAREMCTAVKEFEIEGCGSLTDVRFVIYQKEMVNDFKHAATQAQGVAGTNRKPSMVAPRNRSENASSNANSVCLIFYAIEDSDIRKAIAKLDELIEGEVTKTSFTDSIIQRFDDRQKQALRRIADINKIEFRHTGEEVEITGMMANVLVASKSINTIIKDAIQIDNDKHAAMILKDVVQWYYIDDKSDELTDYEINLNYRIEKAFKKETAYSYIDTLDEIPQDWKDMKGNHYVHGMFTTDPKYTTIATAFTTSAGSTFTIQKIEMVQNKSLWQQYAAKKKQLEGQNPPETQNERFLWHGTSVDTVDSVNAHGFNRSYCGKNAVTFGQGVYFAVDASYSAQDIYSRKDRDGVQRMYYCAVLTGEYALGKKGIRVTPPKPSGGKNAVYDSVTNNVQNPTMFIIFNDTQAYPLYIVHFKKIPY